MPGDRSLKQLRVNPLCTLVVVKFDSLYKFFICKEGYRVHARDLGINLVAYVGGTLLQMANLEVGTCAAGLRIALPTCHFQGRRLLCAPSFSTVSHVADGSVPIACSSTRNSQ